MFPVSINSIYAIVSFSGVHLWKFDDDADRRNHWNNLFANDDFMDFAGDLRPLLLGQQNQLLNAAPWGPHP